MVVKMNKLLKMEKLERHYETPAGIVRALDGVSFEISEGERVILLGIGLLIDQIFWVLLLIAVVSCFTLFQRMFTIRQELNQGG